MLVNGTTLSYSATSTGSYTTLAGLKEVPDLGAEPEMVDNTALSDSVIHNELGIGDPGDLEYTFRFKNTEATDAYRVLYARNGQLTYFKHTLVDGTTFSFSAQPSVRLSGGGVNDPQEFVLALALQSDITKADPTGTTGVA